MIRLLSLLLFLSLLACGNSQSATESPAADTFTPPTSQTSDVPPITYEDITPVEFAELMGNENVVVLDVRTPAEIANGKIDGAVEIDYKSSDFEQRLTDLNKDKTYLVYCAVGGRSSRACDKMAEAGFTKLYNLDGGYTAWKGE